MRRSESFQPTARGAARWFGRLACAATLVAAMPALAQQQQEPASQPDIGQAPAAQQQGQRPVGAPQTAPAAGQANPQRQPSDPQRPSTDPQPRPADEPQARQGQGQTPPDVTLVMIEQAAQQPPVEISAGELAANPSQYYGRNVRIRAEVEQVIGPRTFTLDEDRAFAGPDVLVLSPIQHATPEDGSHVTVTGVVRPYVRTQLDRDYDWFDLDDDLEVTIRTRPVVVANTISPEDQSASASE